MPDLSPGDAIALSALQIEALLEVLPVAAFRVDADGVTRYANPAAEELLELKRGELAGRRFDQLLVVVSPLDGKPLQFDASPVPRALRGERVAAFEVALHLPGEPQPRILSFDAAPYRDASGDIAGVLVSARDLTEQHRSREALRASQQRFHSVLNNTTMAVFVMDERQHCIYANAAAEALTGYRFEEMQGRLLHDVVHHTRPDGSHYPVEECPIDRASPQDFRVQGEETFVHRDGGLYPVAFTASPIRDGASRAVGTVIEVRGIAEEKRRETERQEVEHRFRHMADHVPVMIWVTDAEGVATYVNRGWCEFTGQTAEEALGFGWLEAVHEEDRGWSGETFLAANARHEPFRLEYRLRRADGVYRWSIDAASPRFSVAGEFLGYIGSVIDIDERHESERRLRETEERYRLALSATQDAIWDWDLQSNHVLWNEALEAAYGWAPSSVEPTGEWWLAHIHPDDQERVGHSIHAVIDGTGTSWSDEYRFLRADGSYAEVFDRGTVLRDAQGRAVRMIGAMLDQTEQKRQQAALRESELMLRSLIEAMPNMAWIAGADGTLEWLNAGWYEYIGSAPGSDLGHGWSDYLHPDDREVVVAKWQAAAASGRAFANEHRFRGGNGQYRWFLVRATPILDARGRIARWFGTCTDIQDLVEARNVLNRSREELVREVEVRTRELDRLWSISEDLFVVCDRELACRNVNPAWKTALDYDASDLLGRRFESLVDPADVQRFRDALSSLRRTGSVKDLDIRLRAKGGTSRWYTWSCRAEGEVFYASGRDVTQRMELEKQLRQAQKMETVGKLTGGIAHDFNNLLQVISGNLHLLAHDMAGNPRAEVRVQNALAGVNRGSKLASQLLAFGRRQPLEPKVVNIGRLLQGMDDMLRRTLGEAIEVKTVIADGLWNALVDPAQIENAILNLAINARDAMDGVGKLIIEAGNAHLDDAYARNHAEVSPGQYVIVAVTDTGCGMTPEIMAQVFEPFFTTKPEGKGSGLGLSMVYGFVKQSGGHVKIYSEPGEGTTVKLYLPRSTAVAYDLVPTESGPVKGGTETILVAEDDEDVRATAVDMLSALGYRVLKARDAASALSIIESGIPIDLLFTDVVMPGPLRSPELARKAKEHMPGIAVLFASGYTENAIVHGGRLDPGVELLGKPYTLDALGRKIRHVLANQRQRNQILAGRAAPESAAPVRAGRALVLLVEDDDMIRIDTAEMLEAEGYMVMEAATAEQALHTLETTAVDVLITDLGLPDQRGDALAARARELRPDIVLVFATGVEKVEGMPQGAILLKKPYSVRALSATVLKALSLGKR
jgi:PAS domain S-box-containing protein